MAQVRRIALFIGSVSSLSRGVLKGIHAFFGHGPEWTFNISGRIDLSFLRATIRQSDGMIISLEERWFPVIRRSGLPCVSISPMPRRFILPTVTYDDYAIGAAVAEHFLAGGYRSFAFVGSRWIHCASRRERGFRAALGKAGRSMPSYYPPASNDWSQSVSAMGRWISSLPRPVAVFATNDTQGQRVLEACRLIRVAVPHEVAIVGVDNTWEVCNFCWPSLSSVAVAEEKVGYEAASLLKQLIEGRRPADSPRLIAPLGVVTRQSSEPMAIDDPAVALAVRYVQEHACDPLHPEEVTRQVGCSSRSLHERFSKALGRSVHEEIRRVQIERAKRLLTETAMPLHKVAAACGWKSGSEVNRIFRRDVGLPPGQYRNRFRPHGL